MGLRVLRKTMPAAGWQTEAMERDRIGLPQEPLQTPEETIERQTMMEMRMP